jgi:hypothetical protein
MARKRPVGTCHICGAVGPLSYEHIPPQAAFNDRRFISVEFETMIRLGPDEEPRGRIRQGGIGAHTLCEKCNNDTGNWYGSHFVKWCYQGMDILIRSNGNPRLIYLHYVYPLRIIKQIVTMMFSVNADDFRLRNPELVPFVLNREARYLSPRYRFFAYYNILGRARTAGTGGLLNIETGRLSVMSEITYPPFGYVLTLDSPPPDHRLFEITHFARYGYNDMEVMALHLPVLPTHMWFPGDYRTREQIDREYAEELAMTSGGLFVPASR